MVNQNKIFSFEIKRQAKNVFPKDVERTIDTQYYLSNKCKVLYENILQLEEEKFIK